MSQMRKYRVALKRSVTDFRAVTVLAPTEKLAYKRAKQIVNEDIEPLTLMGEEDSGEWCDSLKGRIGLHRIDTLKE